MKLLFALLAAVAFGQPGINNFVVTNPATSQSINQPVGTRLNVTHLQASQVFIIPYGGNAPINPCISGGLYLQSPTPAYPAGDLWRCFNSIWTPDVQPAILARPRKTAAIPVAPILAGGSLGSIIIFLLSRGKI